MDKHIVFTSNVLQRSKDLDKEKELLPLVLGEIFKLHVGQESKMDDFMKKLKMYRYCPRKFCVPENRYVRFIYNTKTGIRLNWSAAKVVRDDGETIAVLGWSRYRKIFINEYKKCDIYLFVHVDMKDKMYNELQNIIKE